MRAFLGFGGVDLRSSGSPALPAVASRLEWEDFQHDIVTDYLAWQAKIVNEYKRPDQFITQNFSGGVHTNLDQWAIARTLDIVAENPYFRTQTRLNAQGI